MVLVVSFSIDAHAHSRSAEAISSAFVVICPVPSNGLSVQLTVNLQGPLSQYKHQSPGLVLQLVPILMGGDRGLISKNGKILRERVGNERLFRAFMA